MESRPIDNASFETFFALGSPTEESPFLYEKGKKIGKNLFLKSSLLSALLLLVSYLTMGYPPVSYTLLLLVYILSGTPALIGALEDLAMLNVNIDVLMTLAAYSSIFIGGAYEGGLLLVLFAISGSLEEMVSEKAKGAIQGLKTLSPKKALVLQDDGKLIERAIEEVPINSLVIVRAGEYVPLDGEIIEGRSLLNLAHLTGEAEPLPKAVGDIIPAGAIALDGTLTVKVTHTSADSTLSKIIKLVTEAEEKKPRLEKWFDRFSSRYATSIILLAAFAAAILPFFGLSFLGNEGALYRALAFLIAASPCALIIALPTAYLSAISASAKKGILLKGGAILDAVGSANNVAFDKTGTLTTGELEVVSVTTWGGLNRETAFQMAGSLERGAKHPIGEAIIRGAKTEGVELLQPEKIVLLPGFGIEGLVKAKKGFIGHASKLGDQCPAEVLKVISSEREKGRSLALLEMGSQMALFSFEDRLRPMAIASVKEMNEGLQLKTYLLTGDHLAAGQKVQKTLGISEVFADLRPEDKLYHVSRLADEGGLVMVGDGVNDAPALARATVGVAMGKIGSGAALDAADVVLLRDELLDLNWLIHKGRKTKAIVRQNLTIAIASICVAAIPALLGYVPLWLAVLLHEGGTCLVGLNALRLLKK